MEMNLKMNILEMATHYTEVLVQKLSERYGFDGADALAYIRSDAALEPLEPEAAAETTGRGRPEKKVKKVVNKSEMVEETITAVLAEPAVIAEVIAEKPKKKVTPKKKADAPVITEEKKEEVVVVAEVVVEEKPKKKVAPKKKADAPVIEEKKEEVVVPEVVEEKPKKKVAPKKKADAPVMEEKKEEEKPKKKVTPKKSGVVGAEPLVERLVAEAVVAAPPKAVVVAVEELTEEAMEDDEDDAHETVTYDGKEYYLKLDDQTIYDKATQEYVGTWNAATKSVEFDTEEDEE